MTTELAQFAIREVTPAYWQISFSNPPTNLQDPDTILELQELVGIFETDDALRVVVFESADPNFFINHYDVSRAAKTPVAPGPTGALAEAKRLVNRRTLPRAEDLVETQDTFLKAFRWPTLQERGARLRARAAEVGPEFELRFGHYLVDLSD